MFPLNAVALFFLVLTDAIDDAWAKPQPSIIRERHVIHTPINFRVIHHYKIKKIPVVIKKHLHFHNYPKEAKPAVEEIHVNHIQQDDGKGYSSHFEVPHHDDGEVFSPHFEVPQQEKPEDFFPQSEESHRTPHFEVHQQHSHDYQPLPLTPHFEPPQKNHGKKHFHRFKVHPQSESGGHSSHELHSEYEIPPGVLPQEDEHESRGEDYADGLQSQEDYDDYEYE